MVNHARTLLLNLSPPALYGPFEELVDPGYAPVALTDPLREASRLLFGDAADRFGRLVTLARLLAVCDAHPDLRDALRDPDPRVATRPAGPVPLPAVAGPGSGSVQAPPAPWPSTGRGAGDWVARRSGGAWAVAPSDGPEVPVAATTFATGVSRVGLPGSAAFALLPAQDGTWRVQLWAAPDHRFEALLGVDPAAVFRPGLSASDDALWGVWRDGPAGWERAAAAALALARRTDELRG